MLTKEEIANWFMSLQDAICTGLEAADGSAKFIEDKWDRKEGGGGRTRIIQKGKVIEKGGVAFSAVHGPVPDFLKPELNTSSNISGLTSKPASDRDSNAETNHTFFATGVSIVIHPVNPYVPIIHMNIRYFEMSNGVKWFGGGIDLTPHYVNEEDAKFFHQHLKNTCDKFDLKYYPDFKNAADDYFFIKHRNETRGIGGIFFDHLKPSAEKSQVALFDFVKAIGESFLPVYSSLINRNKDRNFGQREIDWQLLRRGRYVEFNLVYDRGTRFGLETNGRTESILMSLPQTASWTYNFSPEKGSKEETTLKHLVKGISWI